MKVVHNTLFYLLNFILFDSFLCNVIYTKIRLRNLFKNVGVKDHLKYKKMKIICGSRDKICKASIYVQVCAMRLVNGTEEFKHFENSCYLFLSNMCDYPGNEFFIVTDMTCPEYKKSRRHGLIPTNAVNKTIYIGNKTLILREKTTAATESQMYNINNDNSFRTYDTEVAFDYHKCPHMCTNVYAPVCINVNRQMGKYFKLLHFINHCRGDMYYCSHYEEFKSPFDDSSEHVTVSNLGWSFCAAFKYMQFARFTEVASSMSHYGWLHGDQRYTKILGANERSPGLTSSWRAYLINLVSSPDLTYDLNPNVTTKKPRHEYENTSSSWSLRHSELNFRTLLQQWRQLVSTKTVARLLRLLFNYLRYEDFTDLRLRISICSVISDKHVPKTDKKIEKLFGKILSSGYIDELAERIAAKAVEKFNVLQQLIVTQDTNINLNQNPAVGIRKVAENIYTDPPPPVNLEEESNRKQNTTAPSETSPPNEETYKQTPNLPLKNLGYKYRKQTKATTVIVDYAEIKPIEEKQEVAENVTPDNSFLQDSMESTPHSPMNESAIFDSNEPGGENIFEKHEEGAIHEDQLFRAQNPGSKEQKVNETLVEAEENIYSDQMSNEQPTTTTHKYVTRVENNKIYAYQSSSEYDDYHQSMVRTPVTQVMYRRVGDEDDGDTKNT